MQIIDKRGRKLTITFGDLAIGDAFQSEGNHICIKTDLGAVMYYDEDNRIWRTCYEYEEDDLILPLEITYMVESEGGRK